MLPEAIFTGDGFIVRRIVVGPLDNNVFLVVDDATQDSVIIDAADQPSDVINLSSGTNVQAIITTHGHWDHHQAAPVVSTALEVPFLIHEGDAKMITESASLPLHVGAFDIGDLAPEIVHTPGHTQGSICLVLPGVVLTGDTLFPGGPGATRSEHSSFSQIIDSITTKLFTLDDATVVLPGHGASTTIGAERPSVPEWIERGW